MSLGTGLVTSSDTNSQNSTPGFNPRAVSKAHQPTHRNSKSAQLLENWQQVCPACFKNFNSTEAGDRHRIGTFGIDRRCASPDEVGLIPIPNKYKTIVWRTRNGD